MEWKRMLSGTLAGLILAPALTLPVLAAQETGAAGETFADKALHAIELAGQYGGADSVRYALWEDGAITAQGGWGVYSKTENRALTEDTKEAMQAHPDNMMWKLVGGDITRVNAKTAFDGMRAGACHGAARAHGR